MHPPACTDSNYLKMFDLFVDYRSVEVNIGQSVELGHHDIDVVATDACRSTSNALAVVSACYCAEFATLYVALNVF